MLNRLLTEQSIQGQLDWDRHAVTLQRKGQTAQMTVPALSTGNLPAPPQASGAPRNPFSGPEVTQPIPPAAVKTSTSSVTTKPVKAPTAVVKAQPATGEPVAPVVQGKTWLAPSGTTLREMLMKWAQDMRLIPDDGNNVPDFLQLGYLPEQIKLLKRMIDRPEGKIILSGPTGSGKSTTLRTACRVYLDTNPGQHLLTIEDPLEGQVVGAVQTPIICDKSDEEAVRIAWGKAISSALRLDPDAIMEGEMRDLVSMLATIYAAQTGHLVMTTLHTNSALGIPERMVTLGVNENLLCDAQLLIGLISQRLVPTLCPECRISWQDKVNTLSEEEKNWLEKYCNIEGVCSTDRLYFHNPDGCEACTQVVEINGQVRGKVGQGIRGRTVIAEVIETNNRLFKLLKTDGKVAARQFWINNMQGISRVRHVLHKINEGLVDPLMANRIIPLDEDERLEVDDA